MIRNTMIALVAVVGLTTWGASESFAKDGPQLQLRPQAVVVTQVFPGTTAAQQGIEVGDMIVSVDGHAIRSRTDLQYRLAQSGRVAELGIVDGRTGWQNAVTVYPQFGRIGVDVRTTSMDYDRPVRPVRPIYPPWTPGVQPIYPPWTPGARPITRLPMPGPVIQPVR